MAEGGEGAVEAARRQAIASGLVLRRGWDPGPEPSQAACIGVVADLEQAAAAVFAAVRGANVIVDARAPRHVVDQLCDDLRRLGSVEHWLAEEKDGEVLTAEQRDLVLLLAEGLSLGHAARRLNVSRRTADRRLAAARQALGVSTTTEAVLAVIRTRP